MRITYFTTLTHTHALPQTYTHTIHTHTTHTPYTSDLYVGRDWDSRPMVDRNSPTGAVVNSLVTSSQFGSEALVINHQLVQDVCAYR